MSEFRDYTAEELLRDGGSIHVRAIRPDDKSLLEDHFRRLSPGSIHSRFFGAKRRLTEKELVRFTEVDFKRNVGLVATLRIDGNERIIGVGRYMSTMPRCAEVAFAVADEHQSRGVGTVLLEHVAKIARANGITELEADVLGENNHMLAVFRKSGFKIRRSLESGVVHVSFPTEETEVFAQASIERRIAAAAASICHFLQPKAIAILTDVRDSSSASIGPTLAEKLRQSGYPGTVYEAAWSRGAAEAPDFGGMANVGAAVDLAVISTSAELVRDVLVDCARAGARAALVLSLSLGGASDELRALAALARESGMRLVGPGSVGIVNTDPAIALDLTLSPLHTPAGNAAMLVQSGALGLAMLDHARARGLGLSIFVSLGDKADVSGNDVLSYLLTDERTQVIALYMESFGNPRHFGRIAPRIAESKPIVALKAGRGRRTVSESDETSEALNDAVVDALFQQAGVIRTETIEGLFDALALLSSQPVPPGPRVGIVTNSRATALLFSDTSETHALEIAKLGADSTDALRRVLGPAATTSNPVRVGTANDVYAQTLAIVGADPGVDAVVAIHVPKPGTSTDQIASSIARGAESVPREKPIVVIFVTSEDAPETLHHGRRGRLPSFGFPENGALALAAAEKYGRWRRRNRGRSVQLDSTSISAIRAVVERVRATGSGSRWLEHRDVATLLRAAGITNTESHIVAPDEAAALSPTIGFPLVAKAVANDLRHRGESGCVVQGLHSASAVSQAVDTLRTRVAALGSELCFVELQREHPGGIEAIVRVQTDPLFGPLVVCGLGGVLVQVVRDLAVRLTPLTDVDAAEMLASLRSSRLLDGYRGIGPGDREALQSVLLRVSALVEVAPEMTALELNPVKVRAPGDGAVVLDGSIRLET